MKKYSYSIPLILVFVGLMTNISHAQKPVSVSLSSQTQLCIGCHTRYTPGIVKDWQTGKHSQITPAQAMQKAPLEKRISAESLPDELSQNAVGCFECHSLNTDRHADSFVHMGIKINVVVTPNDCKTCHPTEVEQYSQGKKAYAYGNLLQNPVYHTLVDTITGVKTVDDSGEIRVQKPSQMTLNDSCLGCHGTKVEVTGLKRIKTRMGKITVPNLANWPNQGVGRKNPDGSIGSCTSCHTRHAFSIEEARKPYTCSQCHSEPDVPAWPVYKISKHGNIFLARQKEWDFDAVPWVVGRDFTAPTCATCHNSLLTSPSGKVIAERTHNFGARLYKRIFGLIYSHPQPKSGDTTIIKNTDGLPLPTTFQGEVAHQYLIDETEQQHRLSIMQNVCKSCHNTDWVNLHFTKFENTVAEVDKMVLAATKLMGYAWENTLADNSNPFDEAIEQLWIKQWLFHANTVRYATAMTGAYEYIGFNHGWWELSNTLQEMKDKISSKK